MKKFYRYLRGVSVSIFRSDGRISGFHKVCLALIVIIAIPLTFCGDIMQQVKDYNELFEVERVTPSANASSVPSDTVITVRFSNNVDFSTVDSSTFYVNSGTVTGSYTYNSGAREVIFTPDSELLNNSLYTVNITNGILSTGGRALESAYSWAFTTQIYYFNVISVSPPAGETGVPVTTDLSVTFNDNINQGTLIPANFIVSGSAVTLSLISYDAVSRTALLGFSSDLNALTPHTVTLTTGILNMHGDTMAADYSWSFTTGGVSASEIYLLSPLGVDMASGSTFDFGNLVNPVTRSVTFTIGNSGTDDLNITGVALTDMVNFSTTLVNGTIAAGTTDTFNVTFQPVATPGTKNAVLTVSSSDTDEGSFTINLTGLSLAAGAPEIQISENGVIIEDDNYMAEFGTVAIGGTGTKTFEIRNLGSDDLVISGVAFGWFNPALFTTNLAPPQTVAPDAVLSFEVYFKPLSSVNAKATITVNNNDADEGAFIIRLKGRGI